MRKIFCLLLAFFCLSGCSGSSSPSEQVRKQLLSSVWKVRMSEGTTAEYTFEKNGKFTCDIFVTVGDQSESMSNYGVYEVSEDEGQILVVLAYNGVSYRVEIGCAPGEDGYDFEIAGCEMYRK